MPTSRRGNFASAPVFLHAPGYFSIFGLINRQRKQRNNNHLEVAPDTDKGYHTMKCVRAGRFPRWGIRRTGGRAACGGRWCGRDRRMGRHPARSSRRANRPSAPGRPSAAGRHRGRTARAGSVPYFTLPAWMRYSAICTAFSAAPLRIWSPVSQKVRPLGHARSWRMRPT